MPLEAPRVKADREPFGLRVDLFRVDKNSNPGSAALASNYQTVNPGTYALTGVDLGNGLFYDTSGNLGVDLVRLYGLKQPFSVEETVARFVPYHVEFVAEPGSFRRTNGGDENPDQTIMMGPDSWLVDGAANGFHGTLLEDEEGLVFNNSASLINGKIVLKQVKDNRVVIPRLLGDVVFFVSEDNQVWLSDKFVLKAEGTVLTIQPIGYMVGNGPPYRFVKTSVGCWFRDPQGNVHEVRRMGNLITSMRNGVVERTFTILQSPDENPPGK